MAARARAGADEFALRPERVAVLDAFCDALWLEDGLSKNTLESYRRDLAAARRLSERTRTRGSARKRISFAFSPHARDGATSAARMLSSLKRFYQYCVRERRASRADPTLKLDPPKRAPRFPKTLSEADVEALLAAPRSIAHRSGLRDRAMLEVLYASGLRVSELVALKIYRGEPERRRGARPRQGLEGAPRAARRGSGRMGAALLKQSRPELLGRKSSDALFITGRGAGMTRQAFWQQHQALRRARDSRQERSRRTCCATRSPRTSSTTAPTCAWCRCCSATPTSPRRRSTRTSRASA